MDVKKKITSPENDLKPATGEDERAVCSLDGARHESCIKGQIF